MLKDILRHEKGSRRHQLLITASEQAIRLVFQLVTFLGLAGALESAEFGSAAVVLAIVNFVYMIGQLGVEAAVIREDLTTNQAGAISAVLVVCNFALAILLVAVGLVLSANSGGESVRLCASAASGLPFWALGAVPRARLMREGRLATVAVGGIVGSATNAFVISLVTRVSQEAFVALLGSSAGIAASAVVYFLAGPRATLRLGFDIPRSVIRFSGHVTVFNTINYFARNGDTLLIAAMIGTSAAGNYDRAYAIMLFPLIAVTQIVGRLSYLWFTAEFRTSSGQGAVDGQIATKVASHAQRAFVLSSALAAPSLLSLAAVADPLTTEVFRGSMSDVGRLMPVLALAGVAQALQQPTGQLLQAAGATRALYRWGGLLSAAHVPVVFVGILADGTYGAAVALAMYSWISTPIVLLLAGVATGVPLAPSVARSVPSVLVAFVSYPSALVGLRMFGESSIVGLVAAAGLSALLGSLAALAVGRAVWSLRGIDSLRRRDRGSA